MADTTGLFGLTPEQVQAQRNQQLDASAMQYAQLDPYQRAAMGMYQAGGRLARPVAGMFGMVDQQEEQARMMQEAQRGMDLSTPEGHIEAARKMAAMGNTGLASELVNRGRDLALKQAQTKAALSKSALDEANATELPKMRHEEKIMQLQMMAEQYKQRSLDSRYSADQRAEAAKQHNDVLLAIAGMKQAAPLTPMQMQKLKTEMATNKAATEQVSSDADYVENAADRLLGNKEKGINPHPGLSGMTGLQAYLLSAPKSSLTSGDAKAAETILSEIKGRTASLGRAIQSQSGKLGNMAVQEWKIVSDSLAALDPKSSEFPNQIKNLVDQARSLEARIKDKYNSSYGDYIDQMPEAKIKDKTEITSANEAQNALNSGDISPQEYALIMKSGFGKDGYSGKQVSKPFNSSMPQVSTPFPQGAVRRIK